MEASPDRYSRAQSSEVHQVSFAEHEPIILRRRLTFYQDDATLKQAAARTAAKQTTSRQLKVLLTVEEDESRTESKREDEASSATAKHQIDEDDETTLRVARRMGRAQSIAEFALESLSAFNSLSLSPSMNRLVQDHHERQPESSPINHAKPGAQQMNSTPPVSSPPRSVQRTSSSSNDMMHSETPQKKWRLRSATSEIVLPIVLPFLQIRERVELRLVCRTWRRVVRDWGVAKTIDNQDDAFPNFTRPILRGMLSHSYTSLQSLFLSDFTELTKDDLHPAIPHLRQLRSLDISRCTQLDDSTMLLLSQHVNYSLEVLYIKGLRSVSDTGLISICQSCSKLRVLEISNVPITDEGGVAIGNNLVKLRALYMRDNFRLTNRSIDVITERCTRLEQLTIWGCYGIDR